MAKTNTKNTAVASVKDALSPAQVAALVTALETVAENNQAPILENDSVRTAVRSGENMVQYQEQENERAVLEGNNPPENERISRSDIMTNLLLNSYTPQKNEEDAAKDATSVLASVSDIENEMSGPLMSRLAFDMADILHAEFSKTKSSLKDKGVTVDLCKDLVTYLKNTTKFGKPVEVSQKLDDTDALVVVHNPGMNKDQPTVDRNIDVIDPYKGKSLAYIQQAAMRACLLVFPRESNVCIGYTLRKEMQGIRFHRKTTFLREIPKDANPADYFSAVCVPSNVAYPKICVSETDSLKKTITMVPYRDNGDDSLRHLSDDWCFALYMHVMGGIDLSFDYDGTETKKPTGLLLKQAKVVRATGGAPNAGESDMPVELGAAQTLIRKLRNESAKKSALGEVNSPDTTGALESHAKTLRETNGNNLSPRAFISAIHLATAAVASMNKRWRNTVLEPKVAAAYATLCATILDNTGFDLYEKNQVFQWIGDDNKVCGVFEEVDSEVIEQVEAEQKVA